jgi:hypothetical protein
MCSYPSFALNAQLCFRKRELLVETGPSEERVEDTGLLEKNLGAATVVEKTRTWHDKSSSSKRFVGPVLAYVTPWSVLWLFIFRTVVVKAPCTI